MKITFAPRILSLTKKATMKSLLIKGTIGLFLLTFMFSCGGREYANSKTSLKGAVGSFENKSSGEGNLLFSINSVTDDYFDMEDEDALDVPEDKKFVRVDLSGDNTTGKMEINSLDFLLLDTKTQETYTTTIMADSKFDALEKYSKEGYLVFMVPKTSAIADLAIGMKFFLEDNGDNADKSNFIQFVSATDLPEANKVTQVNKEINLKYFDTPGGIFKVTSMTENMPAGEYALQGQQLIKLDVSFENTSSKNFWISEPYLNSNLLPKAIRESSVEGETNEFDSGSVEPGGSVSGTLYYETFVGDGNYKLLFSDTEILEL